MAIQTNPSATTIVTEAMNKAGIVDVTDYLTRAKDEWLQEILNEIWTKTEDTGNTRLKSLETFDILISTANRKIVSCPTDFNEELSVTLLDGDHRGTAQAVGAGSITLASDEDLTDDEAEGAYVLITSATTGTGQLEEITDYNETTKVATIPSWSETTPIGTITYLIVTRRRDLELEDVRDQDERSIISPGLPLSVAFLNDKMYFDRSFDSNGPYGIQLRYFVHIHKIDLAESASTDVFVKLLKNWQNVLKLGVQYKCQDFIEDDRWNRTYQQFQSELKNLLVKEELPFGGTFEGFRMPRRY